jgi:hypothetical protein
MQTLTDEPGSGLQKALFNECFLFFSSSTTICALIPALNVAEIDIIMVYVSCQPLQSIESFKEVEHGK